MNHDGMGRVLEDLLLIYEWIIVKSYQPKAGVGTDKVHAASVVL